MLKFLLVLMIALLIPAGLSADFQDNIRDGMGRTIRIDNDALDALAGATSSTTNGRSSKLGHVSVKLSAAQTPTVTITVNSAAGATFDYLIISQAFGVGATDFVFVPDEEILLLRGDEIDVNVSGAGGACTASVTIVTKQLI